MNQNEKTAPVRKSAKQRLTCLACTNASGSHKIKLLVIGKVTKLRAFKNFSCPGQYRATKNAWMTSLLFKQWFHESLIPEVQVFLSERSLPVKALHILDNAPCHPPANQLVSDDGNIVAMYFPPNCTALIQPMDQNVINIIKRFYKKNCY